MKHKIRYLMMTTIFTVCLISHSFAATLKTESTILHDRITLGDVFDDVSNADHYLAPAPAMGKSVTLNARDLSRISDAFQLGWAPSGDREHVVIRRASSEISRADIESALHDKLSEEMKGRKVEMELHGTIGFRVAENTDKTVTVDRLTLDALKSSFKAVVSAGGTKKEVTGRFYPVASLPVLKDPLRPGDVISASDIEYIDMRQSSVTANMIVDARKLTGQTPRRGISALKPITTGDVQMPTLVKKGDLVTMILKSNTVSLTTQGRALEDGAEGSDVRVMNISSKQVVEAVVSGPQAVSIRPPSSILSMNAF